MDNYQPLSHAILQTHAQLLHPRHSQQQALQLDSPALDAMTDFRKTPPLFTSPTTVIDDAHQKMIHCGVRLLFVLQSDRRLAGLITANDILGEKPYQYLLEHGGNRAEILVQDIMTPVNQLEALSLEDVQSARLGHIVATLNNVGRQHLLVVEYPARKWTDRIRGMYSATRIASQLQMALEPPVRAASFADLETALTSGWI